MNFDLPTSTVYNIFYVSLTLLVAILLNAFIGSLIKTPTRLDTKRGRTYVAIIKSIISIIIFSAAIYTIFIILNINIGPLLASAGIVGIALGVGARSLIEDLISGFFLLTQANINIGDHIYIDQKSEGTIENIGFRTLTIKGFDGALHVIPNGEVKKVINYSRGKAVISIDFPLKADQNLDKALKLLNDILSEMKQESEEESYLDDSSEVLGVNSIVVPSCAMIRVNLVTTPSMRGKIDQQFRYRVTKLFTKHKISFA